MNFAAINKRTLICIAFLLLGIASSSIQAKTQPVACYLEIEKDSCWRDRNVTVELFTVVDGKVQQTFELPKGKNADNQQFNCKDLGRFSLRARFSPPIWANEKVRNYNAKRIWEAPKSLSSKAKKWAIKACFANDFSQVPTPFGAKNCRC